MARRIATYTSGVGGVKAIVVGIVVHTETMGEHDQYLTPHGDRAQGA